MFDPKAFLKTLTTHPGVYQMLSQEGDVLYVGKARNLKKRVSSYFQRESTHAKTVSLVKQICGIEVIVTSSETEALLLENNLIKKFRPRYNVLFRDDKSYPYIFLSSPPSVRGLNSPPVDSEDRPARVCAGRSHEQFRLMRQSEGNLNPSPLDYPRLDFYRGTKGQDGRYFGPYPSSAAVRESIYLIQRLFKLRQCRDHFFRHRSRPCLQYYIKRCSAPCVGFIDPISYQESVHQTILFLEGKNQEVINQFVAHMEAASEALDFELAAHYRDQIAQLRQIQSRQYVSGSEGEADVIGVILEKNTACIQLLSIRSGQLLGSKVFFQTLPASMSLEELLSAFLSQHYSESPPIKSGKFFNVIVNIIPADADWLGEALSLKITHAVRGERKRWVTMAINNAQQALSSHLAHNTHQAERIAMLQEALQLDVLPQRLECMDISHTMGEATVGSCVVFDTEGPVKSDYRRFNISDITPGDDYAAMRQVLMRRYTRLKNTDGKLPDILFIDGGKGQLRQAEEVLEELQVSGVTLVGIAKGEGRKPGLETLFVSGRAEPYHLKSDSPALHLIQHIRDEAHRFAIAGHRNRRAKARITSPLENIPGIGAKRRRELLRQFGGLSELKGASIEEIAKVPGISRDLAERIYAALHV